MDDAEQVHMGPALLEVDQQHLDQVLAALQHALKPLRKLLPGSGRYVVGDPAQCSADTQQSTVIIKHLSAEPSVAPCVTLTTAYMS